MTGCEQERWLRQQRWRYIQRHKRSLPQRKFLLREADSEADDISDKAELPPPGDLRTAEEQPPLRTEPPTDIASPTDSEYPSPQQQDATRPETASSPSPELAVDPTTLRVVRSLGGSTGARLVKDQSGNLFVHKRDTHQDHAHDEVAADRIYAAFGAAVPKSQMTDAGRLSEYHKGVSLGKFLNRATVQQAEAVRQQLRQHFVLDALLDNVDVDDDLSNIIVTGDGTPMRVDNGTALRHLSDGTEKSEEDYSEDAWEIWSLRDRYYNKTGFHLFTHLSQKDIESQIAAIDKNRDVFDRLLPRDLAKQVQQRLDWLKELIDEDELVDEDGFQINSHSQFINQPNPHAPDETRPPLTPKQQQAAFEYSSDAYGEINHALRFFENNLRSNLDDHHYNVHRELRKAFAAAGAMSKPIRVTRGMDLDGEDLSRLKSAALGAKQEGYHLRLPGYTSAGVGDHVIEGFNGNVQLTIDAVHGLDLLPYADIPWEKEFLLDHGSQFTIKDVSETRNGDDRWLYVHLAQIPPQDQQNIAVQPARQRPA